MRLVMRLTGTNGAAQKALRSCVESSRTFVARHELAVHGGGARRHPQGWAVHDGNGDERPPARFLRPMLYEVL